MRAFVPRTLAISCRTSPRGEELPAWAEAVAAAGADALQIREKDLGGRAQYDLVCEVLRGVAGRTAVLVNGRADVALGAGAAGVHLPSRGVPILLLRNRFPMLTLGVSTHALAEVERARDAGADYVTYGPVYPPSSKSSGLPPVGPAGLARAARLGIPVLALGGIELERLPEIAASGAAGVAAIGAFRDAARARAMVAAAHRLFAAVAVPEIARR